MASNFIKRWSADRRGSPQLPCPRFHFRRQKDFSDRAYILRMAILAEMVNQIESFLSFSHSSRWEIQLGVNQTATVIIAGSQ